MGRLIAWVGCVALISYGMSLPLKDASRTVVFVLLGFGFAFGFALVAVVIRETRSRRG
jgi:hypothetical protein